MSDVDEYETKLRENVQRFRSSPWRRFKRRARRQWRRHRVLAVVLLVALLVGAIWALVWMVRDGESTESNAGSTPSVFDAAPVPLGGGVTVKSVREQIASGRPLVISVLGDSTGNQDVEWVHLWAEHLAETRAVTYHAWDDMQGRYLEPQVLSTDGPATEVWNMSAPGQGASYPAESIRSVQPVEPDLVIYNFGHNNTAGELDSAMRSTLAAVSRQWGAPVPSVAILQNPEIGDTAEKHAATVSALRDDVAPDYGMAVVDAWSAFMDGDLRELVSNADGLGVHPSVEGSQVWVRAVIAALG